MEIGDLVKAQTRTLLNANLCVYLKKRRGGGVHSSSVAQNLKDLTLLKNRKSLVKIRSTLFHQMRAGESFLAEMGKMGRVNTNNTLKVSRTAGEC